jgi:multicomponent K+:H+ antiporter subunit G
MITLAEYALAALLLGGSGFALVGSYGLLRLKDPMQRLHAPTKATTVGVGAALVASMLIGALAGDGISWHELVVTIFLLLTAPLSALFLAKTHIHRTIDPAILPPTGTDAPWATLDDTLRDTGPTADP